MARKELGIHTGRKRHNLNDVRRFLFMVIIRVWATCRLNMKDLRVNHDPITIEYKFNYTQKSKTTICFVWLFVFELIAFFRQNVDWGHCSVVIVIFRKIVNTPA